MKITAYDAQHNIDLSGGIAITSATYVSTNTALGSNTPKIESGSGAPGSGPQAAAWDHVHPQFAGGSNSSGLPWFIVTDSAYGATGDGTTDDTAAINLAIAALNTATRGVLYFPAGSYLCSSALTAITATGLVLGDGMTGAYDGATLNPSLVICSSGTANFLTIPAGMTIRGLALRNTAGSVTAGYGIGGTNMNLVKIEDTSVTGFWVNYAMDGGLWAMARCYSRQSHKYGVKITYAAVPDGGDQTMTDCYIVDGANSSDSAIRLESGGGLKVVNCKINSSQTVGFNHGIDVAIGAGIVTAVLLISNTSIENVRGDGIKVAVTSTGQFGNITIVGCEIALYGNNSGRAVNLTAATAGGFLTGGGLGNVVIDSSNLITNGTARAAINLTKTDRVTLGDLQLYGFNARYTSTSDTNTTDGSSVSFATPAIVLGTAAAAGAASTVIRSDSTIVAFDATVPVTQAFGDAAATGSAAVAARRDHVHGMPASSVTAAAVSALGFVGPILISDTPSTPLVFADLIQNEAQDDLVYQDL